MPLNIFDTPRTFVQGHNTQPTTFGSDVIYVPNAFAYVACGDLEEKDVIRVMQTAPATDAVGLPIELVAQRVPGKNGQFTVSTPDGSAVTQDTPFDWVVVKY
jgi:hypothetical protein